MARRRKKSLIINKAANIAASLAVSGIPVNIKAVSGRTLEGIVSKSKRNSPLARAAAAELADRPAKRRKSAKKGGSKVR